MTPPFSTQGDEFLPRIVSPEVPRTIPEDKEDGSEVTEIELEDEKIIDDDEERKREEENGKEEKDVEGETENMQSEMASEDLQEEKDASSDTGYPLSAAPEEGKDTRSKDSHNDENEDSDIQETAMRRSERSPSSGSREDMDLF